MIEKPEGERLTNRQREVLRQLALDDARRLVLGSDAIIRAREEIASYHARMTKEKTASTSPKAPRKRVAVGKSNGGEAAMKTTLLVFKTLADAKSGFNFKKLALAKQAHNIIVSPATWSIRDETIDTVFRFMTEDQICQRRHIGLQPYDYRLCSPGISCEARELLAAYFRTVAVQLKNNPE